MNLFSTYLNVGALARIGIGVVKFLYPSLFVLGSITPKLEVIGLLLYLHVWSLGVVFEQTLIISNTWACASHSNPSFPIADCESLSGLSDILAGGIWLGIIFSQRMVNHD